MLSVSERQQPQREPTMSTHANLGNAITPADSGDISVSESTSHQTCQSRSRRRFIGRAVALVATVVTAMGIFVGSASANTSTDWCQHGYATYLTEQLPNPQYAGYVLDTYVYRYTSS